MYQSVACARVKLKIAGIKVSILFVAKAAHYAIWCILSVLKSLLNFYLLLTSCCACYVTAM